MCVALMDDPTRGLLGSQPPEEPQSPSPTGGSGAEAAPGPASPGGNRANPKFISDAMGSLYRSSSTRVERGDATRVIGRTEHEPARPAPSLPPSAKQPSSNPPASPRVDVTLWLVLALGLFAIAGVMLSGAL